jgi:Protein of unknown function (DUF2892)
MAFCRKNIGGAYQVVRIALAIGVAMLALVYLTCTTAEVVAVAGFAFALTGGAGHCPTCAIAEKENRS